MLRASPHRPRWWIALLQVVLLVTTLAMPVSAAPDTATSASQMIQTLQRYGIVKGDDTGNLNLDKPIKRAELITVLVRALGAEQDAQLYKGFGMFSDTRGHWAEGTIAYASLKGLVKGDGNGHVRPEDPVTYAESLTLILRLLGKEPTTGQWPTSVLIAASDLGIVPAGVTSENINTPAVRGLVFQSLGTAVTTVRTASGKTFFAEYVKKNPPVITLGSVTSTTTDSTVTISGSVDDAVRVTVNGQDVALVGTIFSKQVALNMGTNSIAVKAYDIAGNEGSQVATVVRQARVSRIDVSGPTTVAVGDTIQLRATVYDDKNNVVTDSGLTATVSGNLGSYNVSAGTFTAGATAGTATITLSAGSVKQPYQVTIAGPSSKAVGLAIIPPSGPQNPNSTGQLQVQVLDKDGNVVSDDSGRLVSVTASGLDGFTVTPATAKTLNGVATFTYKSSGGGLAYLMATSTGLITSSAQIQISTTVRVQLSATPSTIQANGGAYATIRATLVDTNGNPVTNNTGSDIVVQLRRSGVGDGSLQGNQIVIKAGQSSSAGADVSFTAGFTTGTLFISGDIITGQTYTVLGTSIALGGSASSGGSTGGGTTSGPAARLQFMGGSLAAPGNTVTLYVRVVDSNGNSVTTGHYPFTLKLSTSNNDALDANGVPKDVTLSMGASIPTNVGSGVVGVTNNGIAQVSLSYAKSGRVHIDVVPSAAVSQGFDDLGNPYTSMQSSSGLGVTPVDITFTVGRNAWTSVSLTAAYTNSGTGLSYTGADTYAPVPTGSTVVLTAGLVDSNGGIVPDGAAINVQLFKDSASTPIATGQIIAGSTTFSVPAPAAGTSAQYQIKLGGAVPPSNTVTVSTVSGVSASTPTILGVHGATATGVPGLDYKVGLSDAYLQFLVQPNGTGYGTIKVYRANTNGLIYQTPVVDLSTVQLVNVPKASLVNQDSYKIAVDNGAGNSPMRTTAQAVLIASKTTVGISSAYYDANTQVLTIVTSGNSYGTATIDPTLITLTPPIGTPFTPTVGKVTGNGTFTINLSTDLNIGILNDPSTFSGDVRITTADGWYERGDGALATALPNASYPTSPSVGPFAHIKAAYLDLSGTVKRLVIDTVGATGGNIDLAQISIGSIIPALGGSGYSVQADGSVPGRFNITLPSNLSASTITALQAYNGSVTAGTGWYYIGSAKQYKTHSTAAQLYAMVRVTSATYEISTGTNGTIKIYGSGFNTLDNAAFTLSSITLKNMGSGGGPAIALADTNTTITVKNDGEIDIVLGAADKAALVPIKNKPLIFVQTPVGVSWAKDAAGRDAQQITTYQCPVGFR